MRDAISGSGSARARSRCAARADRRRHRLRADAAVEAVDPEVRAAASGARTSGIRSPASSARCRSSGARSTRRSSRCCIATPIALGIAIFISELCPARLRQPLVFLTELLAAIPSIVYGLWGIFVLVPAVRALEIATAGRRCAQLPLFSGPPLGVGMLSAGADPRGHGDPVHLVGRARGAEGGAGGAARRRVRARRHALRSDPRRALLRAHRHHRRGHARLRPRARRDDGRDDGHRQQPAGVAVAVRAAVHDGGGDRQRVHRSGRRAVPARARSRSGSCCSSSR